MKQIWPNYSYSPTTNVLTLTGLNIDRDQLLLVSAPERGRIMYNFADSTVTASAFTAGANTGLTLVASTAGLTTTAALVIYYDDQLASTTVTVSSLPSISGTVTVGAGTAIIGNIDGVNTVLAVQDGSGNVFGYDRNFPVDIITALPAGTNRIGVVTIGAGTVTIGAGTAEIGTVKPAKNQSGNAQFLSVDDGSGKLFTSTLLTAGTAQIGSVTASISNSVTIASLPAISGTVTANTFALQGTAVTTSNFTSTTASTVLANYNATREVLTIFSEGPGTLFVSAGATCTTVQYQVRLSSGDYYEAPSHQSTITHSAVFATAGTARVTQVS
jgi:hypothetical protein